MGSNSQNIVWIKNRYLSKYLTHTLSTPKHFQRQECHKFPASTSGIPLDQIAKMMIIQDHHILYNLQLPRRMSSEVMMNIERAKVGRYENLNPQW